MTDELEVIVYQTKGKFVVNLPPEEVKGEGLVLYSAYTGKRTLADASLPDYVRLVKTVYTGYRIGDDCFDKVEGGTYHRKPTGEWVKDEHSSFENSLPDAFVCESREAKIFNGLVKSAKQSKSAEPVKTK